MLKFWDYQKAQCLRSFTNIQLGCITNIIYQASKNILITTGSLNLLMKVQDLKDFAIFQELKPHSDLILCLLASENQDYIISGGLDSTMVVWYTGTDNILHNAQGMLDKKIINNASRVIDHLTTVELTLQEEYE